MSANCRQPLALAASCRHPLALAASCRQPLALAASCRQPLALTASFRQTHALAASRCHFHTLAANCRHPLEVALAASCRQPLALTASCCQPLCCALILQTMRLLPITFSLLLHFHVALNVFVVQHCILIPPSLYLFPFGPNSNLLSAFTLSYLLLLEPPPPFFRHSTFVLSPDFPRMTGANAPC